MANHSTDNLFRLIKTLNSHEKRYFKLFAARHISEDKNMSVQIFDAIDEQNEYDETAIKDKFKEQAFLKTFSTTKSRLIDLILRSLDAFHSESSIDVQLRQEVHYAELLFKKSLYEDCNKKVISAKKIAYHYERYMILIQLFIWEKNLLTVSSLTGKTEIDLNNILEEEKRILNLIENESEYWNIKSRFFLLLNQSGTLRDKKDMDKFNKIIDHPLLKDEKNALSYRSKYFYFHIFGAYYFAIGDYNNSYKFLKKHAAHIEKFPQIMEQEPHNYITVLMNIINSCHLLKKHDEIYHYLKKIRTVPKNLSASTKEFLEVKIFADTYNIELALDIENGEFGKGVALIPEIEQELEKFQDKMNKFQETILYYNLSVICFGEGEYSMALKWLNNILNDKTLEVTQELYCFSRILNLIIHLELGNDEMLPYIMKSTHRYLEQRKKLYKFENIFLDFIKKIFWNGDKKDSLKYFKEFKTELEILSQDHFEKRAFDYFDFISWAESKITDRPFAKIVQEKFKN